MARRKRRRTRRYNIASVERTPKKQRTKNGKKDWRVVIRSPQSGRVLKVVDYFQARLYAEAFKKGWNEEARSN